MRFLVKSRVDQIADFMNSIVTRAEAAAPWRTLVAHRKVRAQGTS